MFLNLFGFGNQFYGFADQFYGFADQDYGFANKFHGFANQFYGFANQFMVCKLINQYIGFAYHLINALGMLINKSIYRLLINQSLWVIN